MALSAVGMTAPVESEKLEVIATYAPLEGRPAVEFSVRNVSHDEISMSETRLPWNRESRIILVVVNAESGEHVQPRGVIHDRFGPPAVVNIAPGESLKGVAKLNAFFGATEHRRTGQRYLLFWYYAPHSGDGNELGRYGGWLEFQIEN
jgi:hypothetical protein